MLLLLKVLGGETMPDVNGKLSSEEKQQIEAWLREKWKGSSTECPVSGDNN
jgi:hypothetical protein